MQTGQRISGKYVRLKCSRPSRRYFADMCRLCRCRSGVALGRCTDLAGGDVRCSSRFLWLDCGLESVFVPVEDQLSQDLSIQGTDFVAVGYLELQHDFVCVVGSEEDGEEGA
jgi:hypothetical protein